MTENTTDVHPPRIDCVLICGGVWHDMDFARLEILKLLAEDPAIRTRVFEDYENIEAIKAADILITYTYRLAFGGSGAQYGFAAAISIFIFLIVAVVSIVGFRRTRALEEIN